jgi:hypothetical protein
VPSSPIPSEPAARSQSRVVFDLFRNATSQTLIRTALAVAVAWIPLAILSAIRGSASFLSFVTDYASQSRFLIIIPVLILAEPLLRARLTLVVHHFETFLIPDDQQTKFRQNWESFLKLQDSKLVRL